MEGSLSLLSSSQRTQVYPIYDTDTEIRLKFTNTQEILFFSSWLILGQKNRD